MQYRPLGRTGITVSELCLGAMMFGSFGNADHDDAVRVVHHALDAGINFIDTADFYSQGESEQILAKALAGRRDDVVLATKGGLPFGQEVNHRGGSRRWLARAVEDSLRRLGTDWIDLYQVHRLDPATDVDETLGALSDLVCAGKIRAIGASTVPASGIVEAQWVAEQRGHVRFRTEQPPYNLLTRAVEYDVLPTAQRYGMGVLTWSPLAGGWLTGRFRKGRDIASPGAKVRREWFAARYDVTTPDGAAKLDAADALATLAHDAGLTMVQLAIAFVLRHPAVTSAIVGPRTMEHLESYLTVDGVELSDDVLDRIDAIVPPAHTVAIVDNGWQAPSLEPANRRR